MSAKRQIKDRLLDSDKAKWQLVYGIVICFFLLSFFFASLRENFEGFLLIQINPSLLTTDYFAIAGVGPTLWNSAIVLLFQAILLRSIRSELSGTLLATVVLVAGFAFFGTNVPNMLPILLGTWLYAKINKESYSFFIMQGLLSSTLGPLLGFLAFAWQVPRVLAILSAILVGVIIGFLIPLFSPASLRLHQGYTLYNIGFTAGIIGMVLVALFRMFNIVIDPVSFLDLEGAKVFAIILLALFTVIFLFGFLIQKEKRKAFRRLLRNSGRLVVDFDRSFGTGVTMMNMAIMGWVSTLYVLIVGGPFNGPVIGGILSVAAFAAMGKHIRNCVPVMLGVFLASFISPNLDPSSTSSIVTAMFATTLAPLAGEYGFFAGIVAGFMHSALVSQVLAVHGGVNLYNNGFASGFIAGIILPVCQFIREWKEQKFGREVEDEA